MADKMLPEYMGYDRTIAVFSPDGRLFQVEYAKEAVKRGATSLGIVFKDGVLIATPTFTAKLIVPQSIEKIFHIDDHIGGVAAGLLADARILNNQAQIKAQVHKITYEEPIDVWTLAKTLGDKMQLHTSFAGLRPFGVSFILGGVDKSGTHLMELDPSGMLFEWSAYAIGMGAELANKILRKRWKPGMTEKEAAKLVIDIINKTEKKGTEIDMAIIKKDGRFKRLTEDEIKFLLK